ncbi:MAG: hypothetical protein CL402_08140 [Acidiferrobacteraceae bacterium]|nr:hypothetical protein [Acidiferrobacteraceae bacterium]|tara:strand:+ start:15337 stop:17652 length:2316 start_codon:yes stop_codon:yes gene_type:complete
MFDYIAKFSSSKRSATCTIVIFLVAAIFLATKAPSLNSVTTNEQSEFLPRNSESLQVLEIIQGEFDSASGIPAIIVLDSDRKLATEDIDIIANYAERLRKNDRPSALEQILSPTDNPALMTSMMSKDGTAMQILATIKGVPADPEFSESVDWLRSESKKILGTEKFRVAVTGPAGIVTDAVKVFRSIDLRVTITTVILVFVLLLMVYRSLLLAVIPLFIIGGALVCARAIASLLTQHFGLALNDQIASIMSVLLFGAGTDFTLFIVSRYREEWKKLGLTHRWKAMNCAMSKVGPAIATSGGTTIVAMMVLLWASNGSFISLGPMLAIAVLVMLITALTVVPAVVVTLGKTAFWPTDPFKSKSDSSRFWNRASLLISRAPNRIFLISFFLLTIVALGSSFLQPSFGFINGFPNTADSKIGYNILKNKFPAGDLAPTIILIELDSEKLPSHLIKFENFSKQLLDYPGIARLTSPTRPNGKAEFLISDEIQASLISIEQSNRETIDWISTLQDTSAQLPGLSRILFQLPRFLSRDNSIARFEITWDDNPYDNKVISNIGTFKNDIKDFAAQSGLEAKGVIVGGETATYYDIKKSTIRDLLLIGPLILLVVWLILVALLKSLVAPTYLIVSILLSFGSAFGVTVFFFQFVLGQAGVAFENLMWMFVFLIALGADYNIYMMSRIQEEVTLRGIKDGIQEAVSRTGGVITSAGLILAGTFMVLFTLPLQPISQLGFGVAIGVLIDTFIVRGFLVPSMVATIRHWSWWPNPLYKKLHW